MKNKDLNKNVFMWEMNVWAEYTEEGTERPMYSDGVISMGRIPDNKVFPVTPENLRAAFALKIYLNQLGLLYKQNIGHYLGRSHSDVLLIYYWVEICESYKAKDSKSVQKWYDEATKYFNKEKANYEKWERIRQQNGSS